MLIIAQGNNSMVKSNIRQNIIKNQVNEEERMIEEKKRDKKKRKKNCIYRQTKNAMLKRVYKESSIMYPNMRKEYS